jgi:Transposase, Mutator family
VIFIDALMIKIRDGVVANRPVYLAIGIDCEGTKQVLGLWVGPTTGESAKFWLTVLSELKSRGVADVCIVCCDGLTGLPDAISVTWPQAIVQLCIIHLIRNTFHLASKRDWDALRRDVKPIHTAVNADAARAALDELAERWGQRYPAIIRLWHNAWEQFIPFLDYDIEIRKVLCSTNAIESLNARTGGRSRPAATSRPSRRGAKVPLPGHQIPRPHRPREGPVGHALEACTQRFCHHLRRPVPGRRDLLTQPPETPLARQTQRNLSTLGGKPSGAGARACCVEGNDLGKGLACGAFGCWCWRAGAGDDVA